VHHPLLQIVVVETKIESFESYIDKGRIAYKEKFLQELQHLSFQEVAILHYRHQILKQEHTHRKPLVPRNQFVLIATVPENEVFEKVQDFDPTIVVAIDKAVRLVDCEADHIMLLVEWSLAKVEKDPLSFLKTHSWKISLVWPNLYVCKRYSKKLIVSPEEDLSCVKIDERSYDVTNCPSFPKIRMFHVPLLNTVAIISVGVWAVTNSILARKASVEVAPTDLHQAISQKRNLVVEAPMEDGGISSNRDKV